MKENLMLLFEPVRKPFICEICEELVVKPLTMGIESGRKFSSLVQLCPACGAVDLELMQLCREAAIGCSVN
jgi:RNase P subunit RPR2